MNIGARAEKAIQQCGESVNIVNGEDIYSSCALIQPLRYKGLSYFESEYLPQGCVEDGSYTYVGKANIGVDILNSGTIVSTASCEYVVKRSEEVRYKGKIVYIWALLQKHVKEE